jgi:hypothetical protein
MKNFAIVKNNIVLNIIVADSIDTCQELYPDSEYIEFVHDQENKPIVGLKYENGIFEQFPLQNTSFEQPVVVQENSVVEEVETTLTEEPTEEPTE